MNAVFVPPLLGNIEAPRAEPFYFGPKGGECFGWLHRPAAGRGAGLGVVLCNPLGYDLMCAHRSYRYLATRLAAEGIAALRFEYPSTGDSAGYVDDPDRVDAWLASIGQASEALRSAAGCEHLVLFGLRAGATLAAAAAPSITGVAGYVGWSTFASGGLALRELRALANLKSHGPGTAPGIERPDGGLHVAGFGLSGQTVRDLESIALTKRPPPAARCLLLVRDDLPADGRLEKSWLAQGAEVRSLAVPGYLGMMRDAYESQLPLAAVETIVDWVRQRPEASSQAAPGRSELQRRCSVRSAPMASTEVEEEPVWFGPDGRLAGVLTRAPGNTRPRLAVLFPTVGANHRIGSNRLHVELGRELAAQGYLCLRMDIDGAGDSGQVCERERFWEYKINTYRDIVEGARWLRQVQGVEGCVLWGICSGAYMAYHAALAEDAVRGAVLLNLQLFRWRESEAGEAIARNQAKSFGFYLRAARNPETWSRLVAGGVSVRLIVLGLAARISMRLKARWALWRSKWSEQADTPARQVQRLSQRGCRISFVCTPEDTGLHEINSHLGRGAVQVAHLPGVAYIEVGHETSADHTFTSRPSQDWIKDWTHRHLQDHFPV